MKFQLENRLLWKYNKTQSVTRFHCGKKTNCGNTIKFVNVVKFQLRGKRQIYNSVEYSESILNSYFGKQKL